MTGISRGNGPGVAAAALVAAALACGPLAAEARAAAEENAREPIVGGPCEGCEWVFAGMPASVETSARIAPSEAEGEPLVIEGTVTDATGTPRPGIVVYAYQTDAGGVYPRHPEGVRHGLFRGWVRTDEGGRFRFATIRPGGYPGTEIAQHVHVHVLEPGRCTYYIGDVLFADDPRLTPRERARAADARGGSGLVHPRRDADGTWRVRRDIVLGFGVPGYERCGAEPAKRR